MADPQTIVDREKKFWDTMVSKDSETATAMMAEHSLVAGPQGVSEIARGDFAKMMEGSQWTLDKYTLDDIKVVFPAKDIAVIGYTVHQQGKMGDKAYDMTCADTTAWSRIDGEWLCVLHTETMLPEKSDKSG